jgi:hypothetical protein
MTTFTACSTKPSKSSQRRNEAQHSHATKLFALRSTPVPVGRELRRPGACGTSQAVELRAWLRPGDGRTPYRRGIASAVRAKLVARADHSVGSRKRSSSPATLASGSGVKIHGHSGAEVGLASLSRVAHPHSQEREHRRSEDGFELHTSYSVRPAGEPAGWSKRKEPLRSVCSSDCRCIVERCRRRGPHCLASCESLSSRSPASLR